MQSVTFDLTLPGGWTELLIYSLGVSDDGTIRDQTADLCVT